MSSVLFITLAVLSLLFWINGQGTETGIYGRSWLLWGAIYYSIIGGLTAWLKKKWAVIIFIFGGLIFHFSLLFVSYSKFSETCNLCIAFLVVEAITLIIYIAEDKRLNFSHVFVFGIGKAALLLALTVFILNPNPGLDAKRVNNAYAEIPPKEKTIALNYFEESGPTVKENVYAEKNEKQPTNDNNNGGRFINTENENGQTVQLDLSHKPALIFSWWSVECDQALQMMANLTPEERPYLVAVDLRGSNKKYVKKKLEVNGVNGPYYICQDSLLNKTIPALMWWSNNKLKINYWNFNKKGTELLSVATIKIGTGNGAINAKLAANAINETKILPGDVFSFNKTVGERTASKGYQISMVVTNTPDGPMYSQGIGGGICLTSTVLHWAVKKAELEVIEHHRHSLPVEYGREDEDAAVAWPSLDYRFRNVTDTIIVLKTRSFGEFLEVDVWKEN